MEGAVLSVTVAVFAVLVLKFLFSYRIRQFMRIRWNLSREWEGPKSHWFWGHLIHIHKNNSYLLYMKSQVQKYPLGHRVDIGPFRSILKVHHPDIIQKLLTGPVELFPKDLVGYGGAIPWLGYGLLFLGGQQWQRHRKLLTPSFHFEILRPYTKVMNESTRDLLKKWTELSTSNDVISLEILKESSLMTMDIMLRCLMSSNCHDQKEKCEQEKYVSSVYKLGEIIIGAITSANPFYLSKITKTGKSHHKACNIVHNFSSGHIQKRKKELETNANGIKEPKGRKRKYLDFIDTLLQARDSTGGRLTDEEIQAEVDTFMFEGHDTTASGIAWCLYLLGKHKEDQGKCVQEIKDVLGERKEVEWEDLPKFCHLTLCLKESMRLYPPVPTINRRVEADISACGKTIPKGSRVSISIDSLHKNPAVWPQPDKFIPERFTVENSKDRHPFAYIPFSGGPRNCIGQAFAMNEMKITISQILRNFEISEDESKSFIECSKITYSTKEGLYLKLRKRT